MWKGVSYVSLNRAQNSRISSGVVPLQCTQFVPTCPVTSAPLFAMHSTNSSSKWKLSARCVSSWA